MDSDKIIDIKDRNIKYWNIDKEYFDFIFFE